LPRVRIEAISGANWIFGESGRGPIGTTDDGGILRYSIAAPRAEHGKRLWLYARFLAASNEPVIVDLEPLPTAPIQIVVPAVGRVRARLLDGTGRPLDPATISKVRAEISSGLDDPASSRLYASLDSDGWASFDGVPRDRRLQLRFVPLVDVAIAVSGPSDREREVTVVHHLQQDHPSIAGTLVGPDRRPLGNVHFSLFVHASDFVAVSGGHTGPDGSFATFLPSSATGRVGTTLRFGIEWTGTKPGREVSSAPSGALLRRLDLGVIEMPPSR
jgi:hypothetical protein